MEALAKARRKPLCAGNEGVDVILCQRVRQSKRTRCRRVFAKMLASTSIRQPPVSSTLQALSVSKGHGTFVHD